MPYFKFHLHYNSYNEIYHSWTGFYDHVLSPLRPQDTFAVHEVSKGKQIPHYQGIVLCDLLKGEADSKVSQKVRRQLADDSQGKKQQFSFVEFKPSDTLEMACQYLCKDLTNYCDENVLINTIFEDEVLDQMIASSKQYKKDLIKQSKVSMTKSFAQSIESILIKSGIHDPRKGTLESVPFPGVDEINKLLPLVYNWVVYYYMDQPDKGFIRSEIDRSVILCIKMMPEVVICSYTDSIAAFYCPKLKE